MKTKTVFALLILLIPVSVFADLTIYSIDVGQGDAEYIELPNGKKVLIDGGPSSAASSKIANFLSSHNITQIDYVVLTHPHDDHYKGLSYVFDNCQVNNFYDTKMNNSGASGDETFRTKAANEPNCTIAYPSANDFLIWDSSVTVKVLNACSNTTSSSSGETINNNSIVLKITYAGESILLTGDIQDTKEAELVSAYGDNLQSNYVKVPHHGSAYSSTVAFLDKVKPQKAFIEVGAGNSYGHPDAGTITRLQNAGAVIYRTDVDGTKSITLADTIIPPVTYSISGYVKESEGYAVSGASITLSGGASQTYVSTATGYYEFVNLTNGNYVVTPAQGSYDFDPSTRTYTNLNANYENQNFTRLPLAELQATYSIKGYVRDSESNLLSDVILTLSGDASATYSTTSSGYYEFLDLGGGNYTITPAKGSYDFNPVNRTYSNLNTNYENQDFNQLPGLGLITTFFIKGYVLDYAGAGVDGTTITLSGDSTNTYLTNSTGFYEFISLPEKKNYTITPSKTNCRFNPANKNYDNLSVNQDNQNFIQIYDEKVSVTAGSNGCINPAKGEKVKILITPSESGTVIIKLYDILGSKIWEKSESVIGDQTKTIFWNGKNDSGSAVSSGIYLLQIEGAGVKERKKIAVVK